MDLVCQRCEYRLLAHNRSIGKAIGPLREQHSGAGQQLLSSLLPRDQLSATNNSLCDDWLLGLAKPQGTAAPVCNGAFKASLGNRILRCQVPQWPMAGRLCAALDE